MKAFVEPNIYVEKLLVEDVITTSELTEEDIEYIENQTRFG